MADLPDFYAWIEAIMPLKITLDHGLDASKTATPVVGEAYAATDTKYFYLCYADGTWIKVSAKEITDHAAVADAHHAKYTDAAAKAAAVQAGAITNAVTKAPTHDAVYDVKATADAAQPAATDAAAAVAAAEAAGLALASGKNIKLIQALAANLTWTGITAIMTAGAALALPNACYVGGDSKLELADADLATTMPVMCLVTANIAENATGEVLLLGFMRYDTWDWTPGGLIYASVDAGGLSQTAPVGAGDQVQVVGIAISADVIYFNPSFELVEISA